MSELEKAVIEAACKFVGSEEHGFSRMFDRDPFWKDLQRAVRALEIANAEKALDECRCSPIKQEYCHAEGCKGGSMLGEFGIAQERETSVSQLVTGDSVYSPSTKTWHEVRRATSGQLYFQRDGAWTPVNFAADVRFLTCRGDAGRAAGLMFDAFGGSVIEDAR